MRLPPGWHSLVLPPAPADRMEWIFNYKYPAEYIDGFDEILRRKEGVSAFYARYLDSETTG